ncbi:unnamed protein product, partial [Allacma fusca]
YVAVPDRGTSNVVCNGGFVLNTNNCKDWICDLRFEKVFLDCISPMIEEFYWKNIFQGRAGCSSSLQVLVQKYLQIGTHPWYVVLKKRGTTLKCDLNVELIHGQS